MMNTTASRRPRSPYFCSRSSSSFAAASPTTLRSIAMGPGYQLARGELGFDRVELLGALAPQPLAEAEHGAVDGVALAAEPDGVAVADRGAAQQRAGRALTGGGDQRVRGQPREVARQRASRHVEERRQDPVAAAEHQLALLHAGARLVVLDRVGAPEPGDPAAVEHPQREVGLLPVLAERPAEAAYGLERVAPHRAGAADEARGDPHAVLAQRALLHIAAVPDVDERHRHRADPRVVEVPDCLRHRGPRGEDDVVVDRDDEWRARLRHPAVALHDGALGAL